jgi:hypothetical protein
MRNVLKGLLASAAVAGSILACAAGAQASVVTFDLGPAGGWVDGTFTHGLSDQGLDGFYGSGASADNGLGQNGESIMWNAPTTLNSLDIAKCGYCYDSNPISFTASLYDAANHLLGSKTVAASYSDSLMSFNIGNVSRLTLTFAGGSDAYGDGRIVAWYNVSNITYGGAYGGAVPEPATWAMMLVGFGLIGATARGRRQVALAA